MSRKTIIKSALINVSAQKVWNIFTQPEITRKLGGEYVSEWHVGGSIGWKGMDGKLYTHGTILQLEPAKVLQHSVINTQGTDSSVITYEFFEVPFGESGSVQTNLIAREEYSKPLAEKKYADAIKGWDAALTALKALAEQYLPAGRQGF